MSARPRVLHVIRPGNLTGAPVAMLELIAELRRTDRYEVELVCGEPGGVEGWAKAAGITVTVVPMLRRPSPWHDLRSFWRLFRHIRRGRYDVVHTHSSKSGIVGRWAAWLARVPVRIQTFNGVPWVGHRSFAMIESATARITSSLITVSETDREHLVSHGVGARDRVDVIPNGLQVERIEETVPDARLLALRTSGRPLVAWVGRLKHQKHPELLVETAIHVRDAVPDCRYLVVGAGELLAATRGLVRDAGLEESFEFLGWRDDALSLIAASSLLLLTSRFEGLPVVAIEAGLLGVPVVATAVSGNVDVIRDGETGLLAPENGAALAGAVTRLLRDADLRGRLGREAHRHALERYDIRHVGRETAAVYERHLDALRPGFPTR